MTGMWFSRPFHTSAQAVVKGTSYFRSQWRWLLSDISASSGLKNYFKLNRRILLHWIWQNWGIQVWLPRSPSVSKTKRIRLLIMVQLTAMLEGKKSRQCDRSKMCIWLLRREAHMSAAGISHQRIIFWAAVIAAWTPGLFPVSPHPKKGVCLRAIEQTAVFTVFREPALSMVKPFVQHCRLCRWSLSY